MGRAYLWRIQIKIIKSFIIIKRGVKVKNFITKKIINGFVKTKDIEGIILAHNLDRQQKRNNDFNVGSYNLTYNQTQRAKELLKRGCNFGLNANLLEIFKLRLGNQSIWY